MIEIEPRQARPVGSAGNALRLERKRQRHGKLTLIYRAVRTGNETIIAVPDQLGPDQCVSCVTAHYFVTVIPSRTWHWNVNPLRVRCGTCGREARLDGFTISEFDPPKLLGRRACRSHAEASEETAGRSRHNSGETLLVSITVQNEICDFVREIIAARTGEEISVALRPEVVHRNVPAVEELWHAASRRYAVEHTRVESFECQIANIAKITRLLTPVRIGLSDSLPGYFKLAVRERETTAARVKFDFAHREVSRLVLEAAGRMSVGETVLLRSDRLPFEMRLHLEHNLSSSLVLESGIDGDPDTLRLDRFRRAFEEKSPKLASWANEGRTSVLVLESDDYQHANYSVSYDAVKRILTERSDQPGIIVYVETDAYPWSAWVFKDGEKLGNAAMRTRDGGFRYERGRVR